MVSRGGGGRRSFFLARSHLAVRRPLHLRDRLLHVTLVAVALRGDLGASRTEREVGGARTRPHVAAGAGRSGGGGGGGGGGGRGAGARGRHRGAAQQSQRAEEQGSDRSARFGGGEHGVGVFFVSVFVLVAWSFFLISTERRVKRGDFFFLSVFFFLFSTHCRFLLLFYNASASAFFCSP